MGGLGDGVAPSAALETFQAAALFDCAGLEGNSAQAEVMAAASANLLWLSEVVGMRRDVVDPLVRNGHDTFNAIVIVTMNVMKLLR